MILELEKQVCSLESARKLAELGFNQDSLFSYCMVVMNSSDEGQMQILPSIFDLKIPDLAATFYYSAYTLAELLELLPDDTEVTRRQHQYYICNAEIGSGEQWLHCRQDSLISVESCAKMLIYLAENNLLAPATESNETEETNGKSNPQ